MIEERHMNPNNPTFRPMRDYWLDVNDWQVHVLYYSPATPMVITGSGFGDAIPPDPEEIEYEVWWDLHQFYADELSHEDDEKIKQAIREWENDIT